MANSIINTLKIDNTEYDLGLKTLDNIIDGILKIDMGGTGASTAEDARTNLDVFSKNEINSKITPITEKNTAQDTQISANTTAISNEAARAKEVETGHNNRITVLETQIVGLSGAMHFKGVEDSLPTNLTNYDIGDVVIVGNKEYVVKENASGNKEWVEFGDVTVVSQNLTNLTNKVNGLKYAGSSTAGGSATSAKQLDSNAGGATQPIYFSGGIPVATTYSLGTSVPSGAVFTDAKVTSVGNHYTPSADSGKTLSVDASSTTAATWNSTSLVTGVNLQRDAAGHVTGITVDSIKMPANPDTGATSIEVTGTGNAITSASYNSSTRKITLTKEATYNNYSLPTASSSTLGGVKIGSNINISSGVISVPSANNTTAGVTIVYPAVECTTFSSDTGTISPLAVQKGAKMFAITRPTKKSSSDPYPGTDTSVTINALLRWEDTNGNVKNSKITVEDVTNTRDTSKKANVLIIPAEGNKKMVYGYCTDQIDGTSFIGGVFDNSATEYPYSAGLAIGGTSGNLLWKGKQVATTDMIPTVPTIGNGTLTIKLNGTSKGTFTANQSNNTTIELTDTTYSNFVKSGSGAKAGLVPAPSTTAGTTKYLREDGTWVVPPDTKVSFGSVSAINTNATTANGSAATAARSDHNHGFTKPKSGDWWNGGMCTVGTDGVTKVGKYIDFHNTDASTSTSGDVRVLVDGASKNTVYLPNETGRVVTASHDAAVGSATRPVYISSTGKATLCTGLKDLLNSSDTALTLTSKQYGTSLPTTNLTAGRVFFKKA